MQEKHSRERNGFRLCFLPGFHRYAHLIPFFFQQKIPDITVSDPVPAHIELIQSNDILRKIVANVVIDSKLPLNRILRVTYRGTLI